MANPFKKNEASPPKILVYSSPGAGKSTLGAYSWNPCFICTPKEDGINTLRRYKRCPDSVETMTAETYEELLSTVKWLHTNQHNFKTLVLDVLNGAQKLCEQHTKIKRMGGSDAKYDAFKNGVDLSAREDWPKLFDEMAELQKKKKMAVIMLCHSRMKKIDLAEGDGYLAYTPDVHDKFWLEANKWSDAVLFMHNERAVVKDQGKSKTVLCGRKIYTTEGTCYFAKNRWGLPDEIELPEDFSQTFKVFEMELKKCDPSYKKPIKKADDKPEEKIEEPVREQLDKPEEVCDSVNTNTNEVNNVVDVSKTEESN